MNRLLFLFLFLIVTNCCAKSAEQPSLPSSWPDGGIVEVFPEDSPAAAKSPCGLACANWKQLRCPEAEPNQTGVTCYRVCTHRALLIDIPAACWAQAKDVISLRACGGIRCVP